MTGPNQRTKELFLEALDLPEGDRAGFVENACGDDRALYDGVVELLRSHDEAHEFMRQPTLGVDDSLDYAGESSSELSQMLSGGLGRFELKKVLGRGGFGQVHLAVRRGDIKQYVAIKLLNTGADSAAVIRRFRQERKFLAALHHEYIAAFIDAGETEEGRPFYVMEYVDGRPIDELCDNKRLSIEERLELFLKVCSAVQLAHSKFVLHRDIKPSNILVTNDCVPKLVDFGIAKATNPEVWGTVLTAGDQRVMTYNYASPEQVLGNRLDVRSDVYSLGVVLYELMTGRRPYRMANGHYEVAREVICDEQPLRPSDAVQKTATVRKYDPVTEEPSDDTVTPEDVAKHRGGDRRTLRRGLVGDLDNIVMFALRKDPDRRYGSVEQLADDIRSYLSERPLRYARPESRFYVLRKTVRRHRAAFVSAAAAVFALAGGLGASMVLYFRAEDRADQLVRVTEFQRSMLADIDVEAMGLSIIDEQRRQLETAGNAGDFSADEAGSPAARFDRVRSQINPTDLARNMVDAHILGRAARTIETDFNDDPIVEASLRQTIGDTYVEIGMYSHAMTQMQRALELYRANLGSDGQATLRSLVGIGGLLKSMGRLADAERYHLEALDGLRRTLGEDHRDTLDCVASYGSLLLALGRHDEAETHVRRALAGRRSTLGDLDLGTIESVADLARVLLATGDLKEAEPYFRQSMEGFRRALGPDHPDTIDATSSMGVLLRELDRLGESEEHFRRAWIGERRVHGGDHPKAITARMNLGEVLRLDGKHVDAEEHLTQAVLESRRVLGSEHPVTLSAISHMGVLLRQTGNFEEAEPYFREAYETGHRLRGADHPDVLSALSNLGLFLEAAGRLQEAEPYCREALERRRRVLGDEHPDTLQSVNRMAGLLRNMGRIAEADPLYREALDRSRSTYGEEHRNTIVAVMHMGDLCRLKKMYTEAEAHYRDAQSMSRRVLGADHPLTLRSVGKFGILFQEMDDPKRALPHFESALESLRGSFPADHPDCVYWEAMLGSCLRDSGDIEAALKSGGSALELGTLSLTDQHPRLSFIRVEYAKTLIVARRFEEAESELLRAWGASSALVGPQHEQSQSAVQALVELYDAKGDVANAEDWRQKVVGW